MIESTDGGRSFLPRTLVRENATFKRGLDMGYDRMKDHHLLWGEGGKAFYLKNLEGKVSSVFDVRKRERSAESVKYLTKYPPREGRCDCPDCWCEEVYTSGGKVVGGDELTHEGGYREWVEESYISQPSLLIDEDKVTVVGRQIRMWDNKPVPNPAWAAMTAVPVYGDPVIHGDVLTRFPVGWRATWKKSQEPGDESLWATLGFQTEYLYQGTWHEQDEIKVAQRPLSEGGWAAGPGTDAADGWVRGGWQEDVLQSWRVTTAAVVGGGVADGMPSYPRVASAPYGLVMVYEDGTSSNPNRPGFNKIQFQASVDDGRTWSRPRTVGVGYLPQVGVTDAGELSILAYAPTSPEGGAIQGYLSVDGGASFHEQILGTRPARPVHWKTHGAGSDTLWGRVALATHENLFFAVWVESKPGAMESFRVVSARASHVSEVAQYDVALPKALTRGQSARVTVTGVVWRFSARLGTTTIFSMRLGTRPLMRNDPPKSDAGLKA